MDVRDSYLCSPVEKSARSFALPIILFTSILVATCAAAELEPPAPTRTRDLLAYIGMHLFTDERLSITRNVSCATCHVPEKAFTDGRTVAVGNLGRRGTRNTPSLWDVGTLPNQFWDGRRTTLEQQAIDPLLNSREHGLPSAQILLETVRADRNYQADFKSAFGITSSEITIQHISQALAAFERMLVSSDSAFDRYQYGGDTTALSESAMRGFRLFDGRAGCANCHILDGARATFTDFKFHFIGVNLAPLLPRLAELAERVAAADRRVLDGLISEDSDIAALGRFVVTKNPQDIGRFRTPSLRNVAVTGPYMHDGSVPTLEMALEFEAYYRGLETNQPLMLTPSERSDLIAFLHSLTSSNALTFPVTNR